MINNFVEWNPMTPYRMVGQSSLLRLVLKQIEKVAKSDYNILITGETGVGKELVARNLHLRSKRTNCAFVPINCGGISDSLLEGELFGHDPHSFTGAASKGKPGKIELANNGTLFLDEVGEMNIHGQLALLRAVETKSIVRLGSAREVPIDFRIISATNINLENALKEGKIREDFYYRINIVRFHIPPLRERREDIPLLAYYFMDRYCQEQRIPKKTFNSDAISKLNTSIWPGNIRELENVVKKCTIYVDDNVVTGADLEHMVAVNDAKTKEELVLAAVNLGISVNEYESLVLTVLRASFGPMEIAKIIGRGKSTVYRKMERYGIREGAKGEQVINPERFELLKGLRERHKIKRKVVSNDDNETSERTTSHAGDIKSNDGNGTNVVLQDVTPVKDLEKVLNLEAPKINQNVSVDELFYNKNINSDLVHELYKSLNYLHIDDESFVSLLSKKNSAISTKDYPNSVIFFEQALYRIDELGPRIYESHKQLSVGMLNQELSVIYLHLERIDKAIETEKLSNEALKILEKKISDTSILRRVIARNYTDMCRLKYKIGVDNTEELNEAKKYLWVLFKDVNLTNPSDLEELCYCMTLLQRKTSSDNIDMQRELSEQTKEVYEFMQNIGMKTLNYDTVNLVEQTS